jgi:hypothetical protein
MSNGNKTLNAEEQRLGDAFFNGDAAEERSRLSSEERAARDLIAEATGITDDGLLAELAGLGIRVETLSALTLIPLIDVAWADREMDESERAVVLAGAVSVGIETDSTSYRLLEIWTQEQQAPDLIDLWRSFTQALCKTLSTEEKQRLERNVLGRARGVAAAAGDARNSKPHVSQVEEQRLTDLATAFQ